MSFRSSIVTIASPRPRVGKTLLARLLTDFHLNDGREAAAYDLNRGEATLADFLPAHTTPASLRDIQGEMALFDRLIADEGRSKVIDLGSESFESFFEVAYRIGFVEEARRRDIAPVTLFIATPDASSVEAYERLAAQLPGMALVPVHNELLGPAQRRDKYPPRGHNGLLEFPALLPGLRRFIERPPFSFADAAIALPLNVPLDIHIELQRWLRRIFVEFREMELQILLADLQSSLQRP